MRPTPFVAEPSSLEDAVSILGEYGEDVKVVAGASAIAIMLRHRLIEPSGLVFLHRVPDLSSVRREGDDLLIDALVTHRELSAAGIGRDAIPVLADVFGTVGNVRVRSVATVGGVLAEADYASDPPCALLALDAQIAVVGPRGERSLPVDEFFLGFYETALEPDEIVTRVRVPVPAVGTRGCYVKFRTRSSEDRPCVGVTATVRLDENGRCADVKVAVGAASETPQRFRDLESLALGRAPDEVFGEIADGYAGRIDTLADMRGSAWYRTEMIRVWVRRALEQAAGQVAA
jgi:carbon-monoxide dehydrogenase medium subunit